MKANSLDYATDALIRVALALLLIAALLLFAPGRGYADESEEDREPATDPTAPEQYTPGKIAIAARIGAAADRPSGSIDFDEVDTSRGYDFQDVSHFNGNIGMTNVGALDFMFFPTEGRRFMIVLSATKQDGFFTTDYRRADEDDYGKYLGLDGRVVHYYMTTIGVGVGYRWLLGDKLNHAASFFGRAAIGGAGFAMEGFADAGGGSATFEVATAYHYRFENHMLMGFEFDLRGYGAGFSSVEIDKLDTEADFYLYGGTGLLSFVVGWEII